MKLYIQTQTQENYGAHEWDGEGTCPQYWKFKGGGEYFVANVGTAEEADKAVSEVRSRIEEDSMYYREYILSWSLVANDFLTEYEQSQLDYEGKIVYPAKVLERETA